MSKTLKLGLKLWSINASLIPFAQKLYADGFCDYLELYAVPGTFAETISQWKKFTGPYVIHAPHNAHGFNLAIRELEQGNQEKFVEVRLFTDALKANWIVVHGGLNGPLEETISQFNKLADQRILLENQPMQGHRGQLLIGYSAEDVERICQEANLSGMVLDFSHAVCAANSLDKDPLAWIPSFLNLPIKMFHIGDGDWESHVDTHKHFGEGSFPVEKFVECIPDGSMVAVETQMDPKNELKDCQTDLIHLRNLCQLGGISK